MDWNRLERLLQEASELSGDRREPFLRHACGDDPELLAEALRLLPHLEAGRDYFSALAADVGAPADVGGELRASDRIGRYRLLELLGEGGMGQVWLAEQSDPVKRRVALKVIKLGMDTREVVVRFESERQALAVMDHPGIARVFDGGMTETGRPYFVMEAVNGVPITEYCDTHRLSTAERVRLFVHVCEAVQHAHLKGVIHRDLKPSNVLVGVHEAGPASKVIDFGVAKAVSGTLTDRTLATSIGQMVGTLAYMSPEQAERSALDVDSRTDVYALGVMLYELLVGALPFEAETLRQPELILQFMLRNKEVPTPSARLGDLADTQNTVASARRTDVRTLRRQLRGDLDWIVMRAMEKDRSRRYETANALAQDLDRYLRHEPVDARRPTAAYKLRRFVRRNRVAVVGVAATVVALLAGIVGTSVGLVRASEAEADARQALLAAEREAETAEAVAAFLSELFGESLPSRGRGEERTAREILDIGAERVRNELRDQPIVQSRLMQRIGSVYGQLSLFPQATELLEEALVIRERELGPDHVEVGELLIPLARYLPLAGTIERREELYRRAWGIYERERVDGQPSRGVEAAQVMLAIHLASMGRLEEAAELFRTAIASFESRPQQDIPLEEFNGQSARLWAAPKRRRLASIYLMMGRVEEALAEYHAVLPIFRAELPPDHEDVALTLTNIGAIQRLRGDPKAAHAIYEEVLGLRLSYFGEWHLRTAQALMNVGYAAELLGRLDEAEAHHRRALVITDSIAGPTSSNSGQVYWNLGNVALRRGEFEAAESHFRTSVRLKEPALPPGHSQIGQLTGRIAEAVEGQGRIDEAADLVEEGLDIMEGYLGVGSPGVEYETYLSIRMRLASGDTALAEAKRVAAVERAESASGEGPALVNTLEWLADFYLQTGSLDRAREAFQRALDVRARTAAPSPTEVGYASTVQGIHWGLGGVLAELGRWEEAAAVLSEAVADYDRANDPTFDQTRDLVLVLQRLSQTLGEIGRDEQAEIAAERAATVRRSLGST